MTPHPCPPRRILIVRLSALGDVVMASGLIPALRQRFPEAELSWLCETASVPLLRHNPRLKQILVWPREQWRSAWRERRWRDLWIAMRDFRTMLRAQQFDLVLDGQGLLKSGICAWLTGAPRILSITPREGSRLLVHERITPPPNISGIISSEYRYLAHYLGADADAFELDLSVGEAAHALARSVLAQAGVQSSFVALCPFTTRPQKHWFDERWSDLAGALHRRGLTPVMFGGPSDRDAAQRIACMNPCIVNLTGELKLDESAAALSDAVLLIGVDTGLTHMGTALRIPTLALFGSTRPYLVTDSPITRVLYDELPCSPCHRNPTCAGRFECMRSHSVQSVLDAAMALHQSTQSP